MKLTGYIFSCSVATTTTFAIFQFNLILLLGCTSPPLVGCTAYNCLLNSFDISLLVTVVVVEVEEEVVVVEAVLVVLVVVVVVVVVEVVLVVLVVVVVEVVVLIVVEV